MDRLVAFGCSNTYGHGLRDCFIPPYGSGHVHSNLAWPSKLAEHFNRSCVNLARPGISNMSIIDIILECEFQNSDLVVVMWTYPDRDVVRSINDEELFEINSESLDTKFGKKWLLTHTDYNQAVKSMQAVHHAYHYFESIGIEHYHVTVPLAQQITDVLTNQFGHMIKPFPKYFTDLDLLDSNMLDYKQRNLPSALDGGHAGEEAHTVFAQDLYKEITQKRKYNVN